MSAAQSLNIALLSYRGHPHVGGQGVYVHYLSRALVELGHSVTVFAGPPYPEVVDGVNLIKVPSLDLYRPEDPFRRPRRNEFRTSIDVLEYALMCTAAFPEPMTFSLRVARLLRERSSQFDIVHDNQCLGYGLLSLTRRGIPVIATIHHPIPVDKRLELGNTTSSARRLSIRRWYSFTRMQSRVARRLPRIITVSSSAREDIRRAFGLPEGRMAVVHNGVDTELFRPLGDGLRKPGRIITVASSARPIKGLAFAIEATAKLSTERDVELVVVGRGAEPQFVNRLAERYGAGDVVHAIGSVDALTLVELYGSAEVAAVPSLYEGFSFPAIQAMSCGIPLIATNGGALPEVVGADAHAGMIVPPGDAGALANAIGSLLDDPRLRADMGAAGRRRATEHFSWASAAGAVVEQYRTVIAEC